MGVNLIPYAQSASTTEQAFRVQKFNDNFSYYSPLLSFLQM
jgi:hypothetical protein